MSKTFRSFFMFLAACVAILHLFNNSDGQDIDVKIKISAGDPAIAEISGSFLSQKPRKNRLNLSFLNEYAGVSGLVNRISNVELSDRDGRPVVAKRFNAGEYLADSDFTNWKYRVNLEPLKQLSAAAHISWIKGDSGLLMLDDLLPQGNGERISAKVKIEVPQGWEVFSTEPFIIHGRTVFMPQDEYTVANVEKASFLIGRNLRGKSIQPNGAYLIFFTSGEWQFNDDEAANLAAEIYANYVKMFGPAPNHISQIAIMKFPVDVAVGNWEADTRGSSVTIVSSDMPFWTQSIQRLHEQLRHEIFHLWIPNGVNITGNYDWFYEGFALYESLKIGVATGRITFDDFLDTLSRAYDIDRMRSQKLSLVEASKNRWNGSNTQVYARGMLVAFLCDLSLLEKSKGERSVGDLLREFYIKYHSTIRAQDGNTAALALLRSHAELSTIVERNITGADGVDWNVLLNAAGLDAVNTGQATKLKVTPRPSGRQRDLLDKLGYNSWRK